MNNFYNTTNEAPEEHKRYVSAAKAQDKAVLSCFLMATKGEVFAPSEVHEKLLLFKMIGESTPLTSIRRSFTTLTKQGQLEKTEVRKLGPLGRSEMCWKLAPLQTEDGQLRMF